MRTATRTMRGTHQYCLQNTGLRQFMQHHLSLVHSCCVAGACSIKSVSLSLRINPRPVNSSPTSTLLHSLSLKAETEEVKMFKILCLISKQVINETCFSWKYATIFFFFFYRISSTLHHTYRHHYGVEYTLNF